MTHHTVLRPRATKQLRGPAWLARNIVVLDVTQASYYDPLTESRLAIELGGVTTADDVVAFVQRFGLLNTALAEQPVAHMRSGRGDKPLTRLCEPVKDILAAAAALRTLIRTAMDVRRAAEGHTEAVDRLRVGFRGADDRAVILNASAWVTRELTHGLADARAIVYDRAAVGESVPPGQFKIGIRPETLLEVCYLMTAHALASKEPLDLCQECQRPFVAEDARQIFCTPTCANRARYRRFRTKQTAKTTPKKKRSRHDKKTR